MAYVNNERLEDFLTTAIEGGSAYWANDRDMVKEVSVKVNEDRSRITEVTCEFDIDGKGWKIVTVTATEARKALEAAKINQAFSEHLRKRIKSILTDPDYDDDADDGDIVLQLALFGDVVFG